MYEYVIPGTWYVISYIYIYFEVLVCDLFTLNRPFYQLHQHTQSPSGFLILEGH